MKHTAETVALTLIMVDDVPGAMNVLDDLPGWPPEEDS